MFILQCFCELMGSHVIHQNIEAKVSFTASALKFISSLTTSIEHPSNFHGTCEFNLAPSSVLHFFNDHTKQRLCNPRNTKIMHTHLLKSAIIHSDIFAANSLLGWYCKSSAMADALKLFHEIPEPNLISWNTMISGYAQTSSFEESWNLFSRMRTVGFKPTQFTYGSVLSACVALQCPILGKFIYSVAIKNGLFSNGYVRAGLVDLFSKSGAFDNALKVFLDVSCDNVVCWNAIISGAVKNAEYWTALGLFHQMCEGPLVPNSFTFSSVLTATAALEEPELGKVVQGWVIKIGAEIDVFVGTAVVDFYAKCGQMDEAVKAFQHMPLQNVVSWTAIISGFVRKDDSASVFRFFNKMRMVGEEINSYTVTSLLIACAKPAMQKEASQVHSWTLKTGLCLDSVIGASLINMYSKAGAMDSSEKLFIEMRSLVSPNVWAVMVSAYAQRQNPARAIELFQKMILKGLRPDRFCSSSVLSIIECLYLGRQVHCYNFKTGLVLDVSVGTSLLTMYSKCGSVEESFAVFEEVLDKDNVSWSSMIAGLAEHGHEGEAIQLFREMLNKEVKLDEMTFIAVLTACSALPSLNRGKEVHGHVVRAGFCNELCIGRALVNMYSKCGASKLARLVFNMMSEKDNISCSSLVSGYSQNGQFEEALLVFHEMLLADLWVDSFTLSSIIGAAAISNKQEVGIKLHARVIKLGLNCNVSVGTSLIMLYSKCGNMVECRRVFDEIEQPDLISCTSMIVSYAQHGKGSDALTLYGLMRENGIQPDSVTFVGILSACSHSGLVEEAYYHLNSMTKDFGIEPVNRHYACMVDLLGRSGRLEDAERFISKMPIKPDALVWGTLLSACKVHGNVELGRLAAEKVFELAPGNAGAYVSLSNICADVGQWEQVWEIRRLMKGAQVVKEPGWSFV